MRRRDSAFLLSLLALALVVGAGLSQLASGQPDGLEYVAEQEGFGAAAEEHHLAGQPLADYGENLSSDGPVATGLAGLAGVSLTLGLGYLVFRLVRKRPTSVPSGRRD